MASTSAANAPIDAGCLREPVSIQADVGTQDAAGQHIPNWQNKWPDVWAEKLDVTGGERVRGLQIEATTSHVLIIRWRRGVTSNMRVVMRCGEVLNIAAALDRDGHKEKLWLLCERLA